MRILIAAVADRFGEWIKEYVCIIPAGIDSAKISVALLISICRGDGICRS